MKRKPLYRPASSASLRGTLWTLRRRFLLPDGRAVTGPPAAAACVLCPAESPEGTLLAAPVEPGTALAAPGDWVCDRAEPLGYPFHLVLGAAAEIPAAALENRHGRVALPGAVPAAGWGPGEAPGREDDDDGGAGCAPDWRREWRPLRDAARRLRRWASAGRVVHVCLTRAAPVPPLAAGPARAPVLHPLAATAGVPWADSPLWTHGIGRGRGTVAVVVEGGRRVLEVDTAPGLTLRRVLLDGRKQAAASLDPCRVVLGVGPLPPCWVTLDTDDGLWFYRVEG